LGVAEGVAAAELRAVDATAKLPALNSKSWAEIVSFVALQSSRTKLAGDESDGMADYLAKTMAQGRSEFSGVDFSKIRLRSRFPAALPMSITRDIIPEFFQLDSCLLVSRSNFTFITSDSPVVFYNTAFSQVDDFGTIGMKSRGLQIFYPISPRLLIYFYDPQIYRRASNTRVKIITSRDIIQINLIHYLWSQNSIYPSDDFGMKSLRAMREILSEFAYERTVIQESEVIEDSGGGSRNLTRSFRSHPPIEAKFRFCQSKDDYSQEMPFRQNTANEFSTGDDVRSYEFRPLPMRRHLTGQHLRHAIEKIQAG
jgi:Protein of unknown function (DUF4238)